MSDSSSALRAPQQIPDSFFADILADSREAAARPQSQWQQDQQPQKYMYWYDSIIDDMFSHPGESLKSTALRLGRSPNMIYLIVNSDLFKARYAQRRDRFNEDLDHRLIGKLASVAEKAIDFTLEAMDKKRESIPLPLLQEIQKSALDRLGYGPREAQPAQQVTVNASGNEVSISVTSGALAAAREKLRNLEARANHARVVSPSPSLSLSGAETGDVVGDGSDEESAGAL